MTNLDQNSQPADAKIPGLTEPTLYMRATRDQIAPVVIFSGDPWRVEVLKDMLDQPQHVAFAREFNTYTGTHQGIRITVTSTGIGSPTAAIAMEEMYQAGMKVAIRMGTIMGLRDDLLGKFIIPTGSMREEATSQTYVPLSFPALADLELVNCMNQAVLANGQAYDNGVTCTMDGFYSQMRQTDFSRKLDLDVQDTFIDLKRYGIVGIDMESSVILTLSRLMGIRGCVVTLTTVLENLKASIQGEARKEAERMLCKVVLDGIVQLDKEGKI